MGNLSSVVPMFMVGWYVKVSSGDIFYSIHPVAF